jgi:hypothetical protein
MTDGYVIKIKQDELQDDISYEELKPGTPECIKHEQYEKEFKLLLSQDYDDAPQK